MHQLRCSWTEQKIWCIHVQYGTLVCVIVKHLAMNSIRSHFSNSSHAAWYRLAVRQTYDSSEALETMHWECMSFTWWQSFIVFEETIERTNGWYTVGGRRLVRGESCRRKPDDSEVLVPWKFPVEDAFGTFIVVVEKAKGMVLCTMEKERLL